MANLHTDAFDVQGMTKQEMKQMDGGFWGTLAELFVRGVAYCSAETHKRRTLVGMPKGLIFGIKVYAIG